KIDQRQARKRDGHDAAKNSRADPDEGLDQAEFFLPQLDREEFEPLLNAGEYAIAQGAQRRRESRGCGRTIFHLQKSLLAAAAQEDAHEKTNARRNRDRLV